MVLSEKATQQKVCELEQSHEASHRQATALVGKLEESERLASQEQERMNVKIARMKKLSDAALGVGKSSSGENVKQGSAITRNRALLYDNLRRG